MAEGAWYDDTYSRAVRAAQEVIDSGGGRHEAYAKAGCVCPEYSMEAALYAMRYREYTAMFAYPMAAVTEREMREVVLAVRGADERKVLFFALAASKLSPMAGTFRVVEMARILMAPLGRIKKAVEKLSRKGLIEISRAYGQTDGEWFFCGELPEKSDNDRVVAKVLLSDIQLNLADAFYSAVLGTFDCESEKVMAALSHRERLELAALSNAYRRHREAFDNRRDVDRLMKHIHAKQDALRIRQESGQNNGYRTGSVRRAANLNMYTVRHGLQVVNPTWGRYGYRRIKVNGKRTEWWTWRDENPFPKKTRRGKRVARMMRREEERTGKEELATLRTEVQSIYGPDDG